jgi:glycosyltransferase involved in cell wall biosynthesis
MISVIIPTRNEEKNLPVILRSLKADNFKSKYELLVIDGKSRDKTVEIAKSFGARVVVQDKLGISNARNLGWQSAKGDILIFLEADHFVEPGFLAAVNDFFKKNKKTDAARYNIKPHQGNYIQKGLAVQCELAERRQGAREFPTIFKKHVLEKTVGWDESIGIAEDRELPSRIKQGGYKVGFIENAKVWAKPVDSFRLLYKEGRWYGRHVMSYFKKTRDFVTLAAVLMYASFVPLTFLSFVSFYFAVLLGFAFLVLLAYALKGLLMTKSPYAFLMIPINIARGFGELIGLMESPFIKQKGKV